MKVYALTREGKKVARSPSGDREEILDRLYPNKTAPLDELIKLDKDARTKIRAFVRGGLLEEVNGI